jgi:FtsP/CotA-like multicopper oxidase with cupredoxin domain
MSKNQRLALVVAAAALAVVAFVIASPGADDEAPDRDSGRTAIAETETGAATDGETGARTQPRPAPRVDRIRLRGGGVVGGAAKIRVENGDTVRILVISDAPDEIHLHGYDLTRAVRPGKRARFAFKADIEGEFELEAHDLGHLKIASVVVEPG